MKLGQRLKIRSKTEKILLIVSIVLFPILLFALQPRYKFCVQTDYSVNMNIGLIDKYQNKISNFKQGDYIAIIYNKKHEIYGMEGLKMLKTVGCMPHQKLTNKGLAFFCDGEFISKAKSIDKKGNPTYIFEYNDIIPPHKLFVIGEVLDSFDSKYYGFIDEEFIIGKVFKII